jgi:hypothetical protein
MVLDASLPSALCSAFVSAWPPQTPGNRAGTNCRDCRLTVRASLSRICTSRHPISLLFAHTGAEKRQISSETHLRHHARLSRASTSCARPASKEGCGWSGRKRVHARCRRAVPATTLSTRSCVGVDAGPHPRSRLKRISAFTRIFDAPWRRAVPLWSSGLTDRFPRCS